MDREPSPTRLAAQVVSGIGFLGAGVIMRDGINVRGLNTAATLWCSAAIGTLTSAGFIIHAGIGTLFILIANILLRTVIKKMQITESHEQEYEIFYTFRVVCTENVEFHVRSLLMHMINSENIMLVNLESTDINPMGKVQVTARIISVGKNHGILEKIASRISLETGITAVGWDVEA